MTVLTGIQFLCKEARDASLELALLDNAKKNRALEIMAHELEAHQSFILSVNANEVALAEKKDLPQSFVDRLLLSENRFSAMINSIQTIIALPDPVGRILSTWTVPSGLQINRVATPIGVIAVIYEARPNVTVDAASLCFKSGNAIIMRGGSECEQTNRALVSVLQQALKKADISAHAIQYVSSQEREDLSFLLKMDEYIDVVIPRGGKNLIQYVLKESKIPVFRHLEGICHTYIHQDANLSMAIDIVKNAKMRRTGICGATETLLIDCAIAEKYLPPILQALMLLGCEIRGDAITQSLNKAVKPASEEDWKTEYLAAILSVKVVENIEEAISHINHYGSGHTDAIVTDSDKAAQQFLRRVNSANVMHNCSTQFADGGEFGMGAEIGIATGRLHARGPIGLEQLTTFKYTVLGKGQTRS